MQHVDIGKGSGTAQGGSLENFPNFQILFHRGKWRQNMDLFAWHC